MSDIHFIFVYKIPMFKLNRKIEYALMALKHMSQKRPGEISTAKEIADAYACSFDTIARILQTLTQRNWLQSSHGVTGGYLLIKDLAKLSFYDLSESLLGPMELVRCISSSCEIKSHCNIVSPAQNLNHQLIQFYRSLTLQTLIHGETTISNSKPVKDKEKPSLRTHPVDTTPRHKTYKEPNP